MADPAKNPTANPAAKWDLEADVVVVGSGIAGMAAAATAVSRVGGRPARA